MGARARGSRSRDEDDDDGRAIGRDDTDEDAFPRGRDEDDAFPRGGGGGAGNDDDEANARDGGWKKRRGGASRGGDDDDDDDDPFAAIARAARGASTRASVVGAKFVETLKYKALRPGAKILGVVSEVTPRGLVMSLPDGLRGTVARGEVSDALGRRSESESESESSDDEYGGEDEDEDDSVSIESLYAPGEVLRCAVLSLEKGKTGGKRIELSLRLSACARAFARIVSPRERSRPRSCRASKITGTS